MTTVHVHRFMFMVIDAALRLRSDRLRRSITVLAQRHSNPDAPV